MSTTATEAHPQTSGERYRREFEQNVCEFPKVPAPVYRHAAPSAPWPWMNFDVDASKVQRAPPGLSDHTAWGHYPQSLFPNWTHEQVNRSQMLTKCGECEVSTVYKVGISDDGNFDKQVETRAVRKDDAADLAAYWNHLGTPPPANVRVQALFVEDMTLPVLQMLGTRYTVEPFFFASTANWIPSRYQEDPKALEDHITVVLPFIRVHKNQRPITRTKPMSIATFASTQSQSGGAVEVALPYTKEEQTIDTQAPLPLPDDKILFQDLLSLHMVRNTTASTIISCHPSLQSHGTSARRLQSLVQRTGNSVYWSKIFKRSKDPTFLFLAILWYALYAWDEAFEVLSAYINALEHEVLLSNDIKLTQELHRLQAHTLYYQQLLRDFLRSVEFVRDIPNPAMNTPSISQPEREDSAKLMRTEADNLITEIMRLTRQREMMSDRLDNVIHLTFATVSIEDSRQTQGLAEATVRDSAAMKQIAYLSMIFLPATYLANVFSMNVREINPPQNPNTTEPHLADYIISAVALTLFTSWLVIALQKESIFHPRDCGVLRRALWPLFYSYGVISKRWFEGPADRRSPPDSRSSGAFDEKYS